MSVVRPRAKHRNRGVNLRSFATSQPRPAPASWGRVLAGFEDGDDDAWWLVVSVKPSCHGCEDFLREAVSADPLRLLIVSGVPTGEWSRGAAVHVEPELLSDLGASGAPYYVVVSPGRQIVGEGAVFSREQVLNEVTPLIV